MLARVDRAVNEFLSMNVSLFPDKSLNYKIRKGSYFIRISRNAVKKGFRFPIQKILKN